MDESQSGTQPAPLRAAVIGAGYLGRFHACKYTQLEGVDLVAVVDTDAERAREVAAENGCAAWSQHQALCGRVDVASVVVPTVAHFQVARDLIEAGIDVLVEKPIAETSGQARALADLAARHRRVLQVGHLERYNPVVVALAERVSRPRYVETQRVAPFKARGTDVNVIMDLMIHDIDLILSLVGRPVTRVRADGIAVLSDHIDIANARLEFEGGCVASLTASRVSSKRERRMRLFQNDAYFTADLDNYWLEVRRRADLSHAFDGIPGVESEHVAINGGDPLRDEIADFVSVVRDRGRPVVCAEEGCQALETALEISRQIAAGVQLHEADVAGQTGSRRP